MLMSPLRTFQNCGSSSSEYLRSQRPMRVTRSSSASLNTGRPHSSVQLSSSSPTPLWMSSHTYSWCSPGPVFYRQQRVGLRGHTFEFLKFRSMAVGNDAGEHQEYVCELIQSGVGDDE